MPAANRVRTSPQQKDLGEPTIITHAIIAH